MSRALFGSIAIAAMVVTRLAAQDIIVGKNVRVSTDRPQRAHSEVQIGVDPTDTRRLIACSHPIAADRNQTHTINYLTLDLSNGRYRGRLYLHGTGFLKPFDRDQSVSAVAVFHSTDGGTTFSDVLKSPSVDRHWIFPMGNGDVLTDGKFILVFGEMYQEVPRVPVPSLPGDVRPTVWVKVVASDNGGASFGRAVVISDWTRCPSIPNMPYLAADKSRGPFRDRIYVAWPDRGEVAATSASRVRRIVDRPGRSRSPSTTIAPARERQAAPISLQLTTMCYDPATHTIATDAKLLNISTDTVRGPIYVRATLLRSAYGEVQAVGADTTDAGQRPVWDFSPLLRRAALGPGDETRPRRLEFALHSLQPLRPIPRTFDSSTIRLDVEILG